MLLIAGGHAAQAQNDVFELGKLKADITVIGEAQDLDVTDNTVTIEDVWTFNRNTLDEASEADSRRDEHARRHCAPQRARHLRARLRPLASAAVDRRHPHLSAGRQSARLQSLSDAGPGARSRCRRATCPCSTAPAAWAARSTSSRVNRPRRSKSEVRLGSGEGERDAYASLGTRHDGFYVQGSASYLDRDYWELSDDFVPTSMEDGGERNGSDNERLARQREGRLHAERHGRVLD